MITKHISCDSLYKTEIENYSVDVHGKYLYTVYEKLALKLLKTTAIYTGYATTTKTTQENYDKYYY